MSTFQVPYSSSPATPSTPDSSPKQNGSYGFADYLPTHPSTTPAGPPPSSVGSFTPVDSPPLRLGSSQLGSGRTLFKSKSSSMSTSRSQKIITSAIKSDKLARQLDHSSRFDISSNYSKTEHNQLKDTSYGLYDEGEEEEENVEVVVNNSDDDYGMNSYTHKNITSYQHKPSSSSISYSVRASDRMYSDQSLQSLGSSLLAASPRGVKRYRGGSAIAPGSAATSRTSRLRKKSAIPSIAKSMAIQMNAASLTEEDSFILATESPLNSMYAVKDNDSVSQLDKEYSLETTSQHLCELWSKYSNRGENTREKQKDATFSIGPQEEEPSARKATFISTLLLPLHHPPKATGKQALAPTSFGKSSFSRSSPTYRLPSNPTAIPKVLLDWLNTNHNSWEPVLGDVESRYSNPTAHYNFWDVMFELILRGKIQDAIRLFERSDFQESETAPKDGQPNGYTDIQINNIQRVVNKAIEVLQRCPAITEEDWNIAGNDWTLFRKLVEQATVDLTKFAEGRDEDLGVDDTTCNTSKFSLDGTHLSHSQLSRRAESRVPWSVYQNLKAIYGILLGSESEVISFAQDWVEATMGLTVWWTGNSSEDLSVGSLAKTKRSLMRSQTEVRRPVDVDSRSVYLDRLARSFERATDGSGDDDFQINSNNPVEVALASVFEGNIEGVLGLLRGWSLPVASAVAEIAAFGGWFDSSPITSNAITNGFSQSDLMVFNSYDKPEKPIQRDTIMIEYANALLDRKTLREEGEGNQRVLEGWQISIALLVRLGDDRTSRVEIGKVLRQVYVDSDERVNLILRICQGYGMEEDGRHIAEKYADVAKDDPEKYGTALTYYARGHCQKKLEDMINLFISLSLIGSAAFPPSNALDTNFSLLMSDPQQALAPLVQADQEAAAMLHHRLTGYATLRNFYKLRDETFDLKETQDHSLQTGERTMKAFTALLAIINSAANKISGGLYDETTEAVVPLNGLIVLLGEAIIFVNQSTKTLPLRDCIFLTKVVENLQAVPDHIYDRCEEFFLSTLVSYNDKAIPASPPQLLKTMSSMTSGSSFSLVGSSMLSSQSSDEMKSNGSIVKTLEATKKGWDWRAGVSRDATAEDVLRILRLGLAKDMAKHWIENDGE